MFSKEKITRTENSVVEIEEFRLVSQTDIWKTSQEKQFGVAEIGKKKKKVEGHRCFLRTGLILFSLIILVMI